MPKVGVILSGSGVFDGSEIHETVLILLALDRHGADAVCLAPDAPQADVINHHRGEKADGDSRNILVESARIARGKIRDIATVKAAELDAVILPGGYGAVKNLSDFASRGPECRVHPEVARLIRDMHQARKPIGAVCIAPAVIAAVLGRDGIPVELTIGTDMATARNLEAMGVRHIKCPVREVIVDEERRVVSSPAYMLAGRISEVADGVDKTVACLMDLVES